MDRFALARELVLRAGEALRGSALAQGEVREKTGYQDLVTRWDQETEQVLRRGILEAFPGDAIVGEEYPAREAAGSEYVWYLDPIDGTTNFVSQHRNYAVSVGCWRGEEPRFGLVLDVERPALFWARAGEGAWRDGVPLRTARRGEPSQLLLTTPGVPNTFLKPHPWREGAIRLAGDVRGVRSLGSVALELCALAAGEADLFVAMRSCPWDHNAARIILAEAGGGLCTLGGGPLPLGERTTVLAAGSQEMLRRVWTSYFQGDEGADPGPGFDRGSGIG